MRVHAELVWYIPSDGVALCLGSEYEWLVREALSVFRSYCQWSYLRSEQQEALTALAELSTRSGSPSIREEALAILAEITASEE